MKSEFVREQKRYTKSDLKRIFRFSSDEVNVFIKNLKAFGVLKSVKNNSEQRELSDLIEQDIEVTDGDSGSDDYFYVFTYVGVLIIGPCVIKCYPKYLFATTTLLGEMKQILKVISRYGSKEQIINLYSGDAECRSFNILAVILFLLNDYHECGIYNNCENIVEVNGDGGVLWDKTINESFAFISNNHPYYMELFTEKTVDDEMDYFKRLHEYVLTKCSKQLEITGLQALFDFATVNLSEAILDEFGDVDYILYRLQSELNIQFNTRKQTLLKTLYAYIANSRAMEECYGISMYGTNSFNLVWEDVCAEVFNNKLQTALGKLELPVPLNEEYHPTDKLIDIIEKPLWVGNKADGKVFEKSAKDTLVPDFVSLWRQDDAYQFIILDAKYYNIQLEEEKKLRGQPGISDVTKQYLYQLAYKKFLNDHGICDIKNCFLLPSQSDEIVKIGMVKMDILSSLELQDIQIRQMPAKTMYSYYLSGRTMDVSLLKL